MGGLEVGLAVVCQLVCIVGWARGRWEAGWGVWKVEVQVGSDGCSMSGMSWCGCAMCGRLTWDGVHKATSLISC